MKDVRPHSEGLQANSRRVVVDVGIFPTVGKIAFVGVQHHHAAAVVKCPGFGCFAVVLVYFRKSFGEGEGALEKRMTGGKSDPIGLRPNGFQGFWT